MRIYESVTEAIGHTPLVRLHRIEEAFGVSAALLAKVEALNPAGSAKDRVAREMIDDAMARGALKPGATVIEPTSGNTGIGLCAVAAARGLRAVIVMPDTMSEERRALVRAYGAKLVLTDGKRGMAGAIAEAERLQKETPGSFIPGQFVNPANAAAHYKTTAPEIWEDTDGRADIFVAGVGTGGTITGVGRYLKEKNPAVRVVAVEPDGSAVLSGESAGKHDLQGIGAGFIPAVLDTGIYDEIVRVKDEEAYRMGRTLAEREGILSGISAGAALFAAVTVAKRPENRGKNVVVLLPDTGDRYLSTKMFAEDRV